MYALEAYNFEVHISISVYCWVSVLGGKKLTQYVSIISRSDGEHMLFMYSFSGPSRP